MNIQVKTAIASHLSDAQELLTLGQTRLANREINYAKAILFKHPDTTKEVSEVLPYSYPFVGARMESSPTIDYEADYDYTYKDKNNKEIHSRNNDYGHYLHGFFGLRQKE